MSFDLSSMVGSTWMAGHIGRGLFTESKTADNIFVFILSGNNVFNMVQSWLEH